MLKYKNKANKKKYSKPSSYCVSFLRKSKLDYFGNLNERNINDSKIFWKTIKPFLSDKVTSTNKITLTDKEQIIVGNYNTDKVSFLTLPITLTSLSDPVLKPSHYTRDRKGMQQTPKIPFSISKINREEILREFHIGNFQSMPIY